MITTQQIGFIGGGQMCEAILAGIIASGKISAKNITVTDVNITRLKELTKKYGINSFVNSSGGEGIKETCNRCNILILAVKPQLAAAVLAPAAKSFTKDKLVISIIGGVGTAAVQQWLPNSSVVRVMPNTPMLLGTGCAGICPGNSANKNHLQLCTQLFSLVGECFVLPETLMDSLTAISGCGPAFAYMFIEALADGGVQQGLPRKDAQRLAAQTLAGAAQMVLQTGQHPAQLKDSVCSPGGGTIAGVHALEQGAFRATIMNAVENSKQHMEKLGKSSTTNKE